MIFDKTDIGLWLPTSNFDPFLWIGITMASLRQSGRVPVYIERLKIFLNGIEMSFLSKFEILTGILLGPYFNGHTKK